MTDEQKKEIIKNGLEFVHFAIQEAMNGNMGELMTALEVLELMRAEWKDDNRKFSLDNNNLLLDSSMVNRKDLKWVK